MMDLYAVHQQHRAEIDAAISEVLDRSAFINGPQVKNFRKQLAAYAGASHVITCGNCTDALQISLMALGLHPGDEVIVPAFTYIATAEVVGLLNLTPVMVDVDESSFNVTASNLEKGLSGKTKVVVPVHLFGQACDMSSIMAFAKRNNVLVIEDNAQSLGTEVLFPDGSRHHTGTMGHIGCTSFFPTKNLGCLGDGGAMMTEDEALAKRLDQIANHGQEIKYHHEILGCNSRLDTLQAAVLEVKLKYLDEQIKGRYQVAQRYHSLLEGIDGLILPEEKPWSTHTYNQFTVRVQGGRRDGLKEYLAGEGISSMIYYPLPLQAQRAFRGITRQGEPLVVAERLCHEVLSLPMHPLLEQEDQEYIAEKIRTYLK